jgi:D-alanyl-D-alanine carboxypeptidase
MPDPVSHGYVAAAGAKQLEELGATLTPGTDVSDWIVRWGQAGGGAYSTIADLGTWAGTGLGTSLLPADLAAKRFATQKPRKVTTAWASSTGAAAGSGIAASASAGGSVVAYDTKTGAAFVAIVNETGSLLTAESVGLQILPGPIGLVGLG